MTVRKTSQRIFLRNKQVLTHLFNIADSEGILTASTYAIACELGMYRQTLSRILQRLAQTGAVILADQACTPIRVTKTMQETVTETVTKNMTNTVTKNVTNTVTEDVTQVTLPKTCHSAEAVGATVSWTTTCTLPHIQRYVTDNTENVTLSSQIVTESSQNVTLFAEIVTQTVTDKKETKQKNEEIPPVPPKEEKKQKKRKKLTPHRVRARGNTYANHHQVTELGNISFVK